MRSSLAVIGLVSLSLAGILASTGALAQQQAADLIVRNARVITVDPQRPRAAAFAVRDGKFVAVGGDAEMAAYRGEKTRVIDARGHSVIPGLNDSHAHVVRGGRFYNLELRWDGVDSLERGLAMIREQARSTPRGQWVRIIGGWSPYQFREKRMPTVQELNQAAPNTPTFVLFLYSRGMLNRAGVQALRLTPETKAPPGGRYEFVDGGAILHAEPDPTILYQMIAKPPQLSASDQVNSTLHFYRELNRLGMTSAVDAGGGGHAFPKDYAGSQAVAREGRMPLRIGYYLFPQTAGKEAEDFRRWTAGYQAGKNEGRGLEHGFELEGGGEFLAHSVGDWENFLAERPDLKARQAAGQDPAGDLREVTKILVKNNWPLRQHATYGESVKLILDVFEQVKREQRRFVPRWAIDHAETVRDPELRRIKSMGGGIAIQDRMAFAGEYFVQRYGKEAAAHAPPIRKMLDLGIPVGAGTDGTRVSSYNPWPALYWLVSGRTVGGTQLYAGDNRLSREEALRLFTVGSAWFTQEETVKGRIAPGQYADFALLNADYLTVPEEQIKNLESLLTVVAGKVVYAAKPFGAFAPPALPAVSPSWSPVAKFGGYQRQRKARAQAPSTGPPPFAQLRYQEDYSYLRDEAARSGDALALESIKYVPLNQSGDRYLSIGGEVRQQFEFYNHPDFGLAPVNRDGYLLQRYMLHGDLHLGPSFRLFGQLKSALASSQEGPPGPTDEDRLDLHQAFFDLHSGPSPGASGNSVTLRVGRQEMLYGSQRLISVREGPNVRRSFDALRVLTKLNDWQVDGFFSRPVETDPGVFDDGDDAGARLWGVYGTGPPGKSAGMKLDLYYLGLDRPEAEFAQGAGDERRHSAGVRLFGQARALDYNFEGVYQFGRFGEGKIRAWTLASDTGYTFESARLRPRVAIRANVSSGDDDPGDRDLGTFNPLYPRGNYFGEAAILGPLNLLDVHPMVQFRLSPAASLEAGWTWYWRQSKQDGVYGNGLNLIQGPAGSDARYIGNELSVLLEWQLNRHVSFSTSYSRFFAGTFLKETGPGRDVEYVTAYATYRF